MNDSKDSVQESAHNTVRRAAMDLLARREHSFHELLDKLSRKYPELSPTEQILPALERLRSEKLQSDSRFLEAFISYRHTRGIGPLKIKAELYARKLDAELLQQCLYQSGIDWQASCMELLRRKFRPSGKPGRQELQRWQRFLLQRGFEHEQVSAALKSLGRAGPDASHAEDA